MNPSPSPQELTELSNISLEEACSILKEANIPRKPNKIKTKEAILTKNEDGSLNFYPISNKLNFGEQLVSLNHKEVTIISLAALKSIDGKTIYQLGETTGKIQYLNLNDLDQSIKWTEAFIPEGSSQSLARLIAKEKSTKESDPRLAAKATLASALINTSAHLNGDTPKQNGLRIPSDILEQIYQQARPRHERMSMTMVDRASQLTNPTLQLTGEVPHPLVSQYLKERLGIREHGYPQINLVEMLERKLKGLIELNSITRLNHQIKLNHSARGVHSNFKLKQLDLTDDALRKGEALALGDLRIPIRGFDPQNPVKMSQSTTAIRETGMFSQAFRDEFSYSISGSSMWSVIGAESMATMALIGAHSFAPIDALWKSAEDQIVMINRAKELIDESPLLKFHPEADTILDNGQSVSQYLKERAHNSLGATLKPQPVEDTLEHARKLLDHGVRVLRIYDPGATPEMLESAKKLKKILDQEYQNLNAKLIVGQVTNYSQAKELAKAGIDAIIIGIGDGSICTTSKKTGGTGYNTMTLYQILREGINLPIWLEGGASPENVAYAMGANCLCKSQSFLGGTIEQPPFVWFKDRGGKLLKPYPGEASELTKMLSGLDSNIEGVVKTCAFRSDSPLITDRIIFNEEAVAKMLRFLQLPTLMDLIGQTDINRFVIGASDETKTRAATH